MVRGMHEIARLGGMTMVRQRRFLLALASASLLALPQAACGLFGSGGATQTMLTSAEVPSGQGTVRTKQDDNGNTVLDVRVKHLAPPARVTPEARVYVVWVQPPSGAIQNVGALTVDKDLEGSIQTVTPYRHFTVTVTPETNSSIAVPTHKPVFSSQISD
jgi:hypothetical protein